MSDSDYRKALAQEGRDLVAESGELPPVWFREAEVRALLEQLERRRSVLLVGASGVGKTALVHALARRLKRHPMGLRQLSTTQMMSGTRYLGEWQSKVTQIAQAASAGQVVLYLNDVWNLPDVGRTAKDDSNLLDALRPWLEGGKLLVLGELTPGLQRRLDRHPGFLSLFQTLTVPPLAAPQVEQCLDRAAEARGEHLDVPSRRALIKLTTRFSASRPQPGPALELFDQVLDYQAQKATAEELEPFGPELIEKVYSVYSGLPLFVVSESATRPAREIRGWFQEHIVGQREAIEAVVETIALFKAGLQDPGRPLGTFLFVGPTGVGKTELARTLAAYLFGSATRLLRFDLSEFKDYHAFETLLGSASRPGQPAALVDPIRSQPFQVVLFDELEKAHPNVWDLLLGLLDEGRLTPPGGDTVDATRTIVICTSNVGAQDSGRSLGFGAEGNKQADMRKALEAHFRPEFLNRFQHIVVFHHLTRDQVRQVARQELKRILGREGITGRNLVVEVDDEALDMVIEEGFDPRYGARALKREIQRRLVLPLAMALMERSVEAGSILKLQAREGQIRVRVVETAEARRARREREPVRLPTREKLTGPELLARAGELAGRIEELEQQVDADSLRKSRARLIAMRADKDFWKDPEGAARDLRDLDRYGRILDRIERLHGRNDELREELGERPSRRRLQALAVELVHHERSLQRAWRELVVMGEPGLWDALIEVAPVGGRGGALALDTVVGIYLELAAGQRMQVEWLREPLDDDEPAMLALKGHYAFGLVAAESGLHRIRRGDDNAVVRVRVAPWTDARGEVQFGGHRALKGRTGRFGGRVRSRLEVGGLVLQNARSLAENRELAVEVGPSWAEAPAPSDTVVRRVRLEPLELRDLALGLRTGRKDALGADFLHKLMLRRVDELEG